MKVFPLHCLAIFLLLFSFLHAHAQTFSGQGGLPFPPGAPAQTTGNTTSFAVVSGVGVLGGCQQIDNVTIDLQHTWVGDIALFLISPSGTVLELSSGNGGPGDNYQVTTFSDAAFTPITAGTPPFNGGFLPEGRQQSTACPCSNANGVGTFTFANTFDGENADGAWQLFLTDYVFADVGTLNSWSITFGGSGTPVTANPVTILECSTGGGQAVFNLTSIESAVNGGAGYPVLWYTDMQATNPIANPANYLSGAGTVYAVVQGPGCNSNPATITLAITSGPVAVPQMVEVCDNCAGWAPVDLTAYNDAVNGGNGNPVNWWGDANATFPVPNPSSVQVFGGSYWATVQDGGCESAPVEVDFTLLIPNCGAGASLSACNSGNGTGVFDLTSVNGTVNLGTNDQVNWYSDQNATMPIANPAAYISGGGTVFAVVFDGTCPSVPRAVALTVTAGGGGANPATLDGCDNGTGQAAYDLTTVENIVNGGSGNPVFWWVNAGATVPITNPANYLSSGGTVYATVGQGACISLPVPVTVTVPASGPDLTLLLTPTICAGETVDLVPLVTTTSGLPISFHSATPPTLANELPSTLVNPTATTIYHAFISNGGGCSTELPFMVFVNQSAVPQLSSASVCENESSFDLAALQDPAYPAGTWSGTGVSGSLFSAVGLTGTVTLSFDPSAPCTQPGTTTLTVLPQVAPNLGAANLCASETSFNLTTLQDPAFPSGTWSGPGVSGSLFNADGLSGPVTLAYTPVQPCATPATTIVNVIPSVAPVLGTADFCSSDPLYLLSNLADPAYPTGTWSGPGVSGNIFDPAGQSGTVILTFTPNTNCSLPATTNVIINETPATSTPEVDCGSNNLAYMVRFNITGGDPGSYTVNGQPSGAAFISAPIASGSPFSFLVDDGNGCGPVDVNGSYNCDCVTFAGSMGLAGGPFEVCSDAVFTANFNNNAALDGDDVLLFVLHDAPGAPLGNVLATSFSPAFGLPANGQLGATYFVSAVAGNDDGSGSFDPADGCLSVAAGVPVVFYETAAAIAPGGAICAGGCFQVDLSFEGVAPFEFSYQLDTPNGSSNEVFTTSQANAQLDICTVGLGVASGQIVIRPTGMTDANGCNVSLSGSQNVSIEVLPEISTNFTETLCPGESRTVNGTVYDEANPTGSETLPNGSAQGCDSIVNVSLSFYPTPTGQIAQTLCPGSSIVVNGTMYDENNPTGIETLPNASANGCDSLVEVALSFNEVVNFDLTETLCPGESRTVNGTVYDEANPNGSETLPSGSAQGCDSIVNVSLSFFPTATGQIAQTLCPGSSIVVNGTMYDENNPTGIETLPNASANGCDSLVEVALSFNQVVNFDLTETLCPGESRTVNGTVYDEANPTGSETLPSGSAQGCDSIVNVSLSFFPTATGQIAQTLCPGSSIVVNGTMYDENNPTGIETLPNASANGCDSLVEVVLSFNQVVNFDLTQTLCPGESRTVNGNVYDEANPTGSETLPNGSAQGCDSIVNVSLSFYPTPTGQIAQTLCPGSSIIVNGTMYDENNPTGIETLPNASANGCDSLLEVALSFNQVVSFDLTETLCPGESRTVNGTVYDEANPTGSETLPNGSAQGCDSIVSVNLSFYPTPTGQIAQTLCPGSSIVVNGTMYDENNPTGLETLPNASANGCDSLVEVALSFNEVVNFDLTETLCPGESRTVNGTVYDEANPTGSETLPNGSAQGCDSIVNVSLSFFPTATGQIAQTLCPGSSIVVNGTMYDENNPAGIETLPNASANGCDSLLEVALSFNQVVSFDLTETLCPGESRTVNGTVYDEANPTGSETLPNGSAQGCDSIVNVSLSFYPTPTGQIAQTLCPGSSIVVNGTMYDENNPTGIETLPNASANGCDSLVEVALSFNEVVNFDLTETLCPGESRTVNGNVYNEANPTGSETLPNGSAQGCDSIVNVSLSFFPTATGQIAQTLCPGSSIVVNGTMYDENNPAGIETLPNASANGCDSLLEVALSFNQVVSFDLTETLCPGESRTVNGTVYDEANPTGSETLPNGSAQGCDSIVNVSLSFYPTPTGQIAQTLCPGSSIIVNGTVYDEANPNGSETFPNGSVQGCDSVVNVNLSFYPEVVFELTQTLLPGENIVVNGTVYDEANPGGLEVLASAAVNGCDSAVVISLAFEAEEPEKSRRIFVPNAFSPNNDGRNDLLTVFAGEAAVSVRTFRIFDRWGGAIFEQSGFAPNDVSKGWDGTHRGKALDPAVFVYFAEVEFSDGAVELFKGEAMLVR